ncbi:MAG: hypothetical protein JNM41_10450 [Flavipsychrobacter sp.]|nr:hypothetical protein [Flavipsychrobacter sp.]
MTEGLFECSFYFPDGADFFQEIYDRVDSDFDGFEGEAVAYLVRGNNMIDSIDIDRNATIAEDYYATFTFGMGHEKIFIERFAKSVRVTHLLYRNKPISEGTILLYRNLLLRNKYQYIVCGYELNLTLSAFSESLRAHESSPNYYPLYVFVNLNDNFEVRRHYRGTKGGNKEELNEWIDYYVQKMGFTDVVPSLPC